MIERRQSFPPLVGTVVLLFLLLATGWQDSSECRSMEGLTNAVRHTDPIRGLRKMLASQTFA